MEQTTSELYLGKQLNVQRIVGAWPYNEETALWKKICSKVLFYVMLTLKILSLPLILYQLYDDWGNLPNPVDNVVMVMSHVNTTIGSTYLPRNFNKIQELMKLMDRTFIVPKVRSGDELEQARRTVFVKAKKTASLVTNGYFAQAIVLYISFVLEPLLYEDGERPLPYELKLPFDIDISSGLNYWLAYFVLITNWLGMLFHAAIICDFMIAMMIMSTCQFSLLELMLLQIRDSVRKQKLEMQEKKSTRSQDSIKLTEATATMEETPLEDNLENELLVQNLKECLKYHQQILLFVKELDRVISPFILWQISIYLGFICMNILDMSFQPLFSMTFFRRFFFVLCLVFYVLVLAWFGNELQLKSMDVAQSAYNCDWVDAPRNFKKQLVILIWRAQKPVMITGWKFFTVDLELFIMVMKTSYSWYQVMHSVYGGEEE